MDEKININQDIYNAVQSLCPIEKLEDVKKQIEDGMKMSNGYTKDANTGKWLKTSDESDVGLNFELYKKMDTVNALIKYYTNNTDGSEKNFNKYLLFSNLRELLKKTDIKIGQIEKEAGHQTGYVSRLEKLDNSTDPSTEFIVTTSKLLKISIDSLIKYDICSLTETELYILKVIDKFRMDTLNNKLDWHTESAELLNEETYSGNGRIHPLFNESIIPFETDSDYPEARSLYTFNSYAYGPATEIADDCYDIKIKNCSTLYIMNIKRMITNRNDIEDYSKEIWLVDRNNKKECLVSINKFPVLTNAVDNLYRDIKAYVSRPKLSKDTRRILDGFLNDDFSLDDGAEINF